VAREQGTNLPSSMPMASPVPSAKAGAAMLAAAMAGASAFFTPAGTWKPSAFIDTAARRPFKTTPHTQNMDSKGACVWVCACREAQVFQPDRK
jgi:hypothetical protein